MKALKIIGIVLAVLVAVVLIAGLIAPKNFSVTRSMVINAPADVVYHNFATFEGFNKWNPWNKYDTTAVVTIEGTDGTVGAKRSWTGNKQVGKGSMTVTRIEPGKELEYDLVFIEPYETKSIVTMSMEPAEGGQKVTWNTKGDMKYPFNAMALFMSMDKMLGKDFEEGLKNLKELSEAGGGVAASSYKVNDVDWAEKKTLAVRSTVKFADMSKFFGDNYPKMYEAINKAGDKPGTPLGVYYKYDENAMEADMAAAIPYEGKDILMKGYSNVTLPAAKAHSIDYYGDYANMGPAYQEMNKYLKDNYNRENPDLVVEEYLSDPMTETDTTKWHTVIYFFVNEPTAAK